MYKQYKLLTIQEKIDRINELLENYPPDHNQQEKIREQLYMLEKTKKD